LFVLFVLYIVVQLFTFICGSYAELVLNTQFLLLMLKIVLHVCGNWFSFRVFVGRKLKRTAFI